MGSKTMRSRKYWGVFEERREDMTANPIMVKRARTASSFILPFWIGRHVDAKVEAMIRQKREPFRHSRPDLYYWR